MDGQLSIQPNGGARLLSVMWAELSVAALILTARIYTRTRVISGWGWDDMSMCLSMVFLRHLLAVLATMNTSLLTASVHHGLGKHAASLTGAEYINANKYNWISQGCHVMSTNFGKVSVILFLLRIVVNSRSQRVFLYTLMAMLMVINSVCVFTIFGQCTPASRLWDQNVSGSCWSPHHQRDFAFFQGSFSAFSDGLLAIYPIFVIWKLQMSKRTKTCLGCVLALGIVAMIAAIIKTIFLASLTARSDYTYDTISLTIWTNTEQYLIIIAACIPPLGPLLKIAMGKTPTAQQSNSNRYASKHSSGEQVQHPAFLPKDSLLSTNESCCYPLREYKGRSRRWGDGRESVEDLDFCEARRSQLGGIMKTTEVHIESNKDPVN
ncbi:integral membrane protein [Nannizzia gypsea CBS 118893]|uniref:Integral membrane protein n=1 Tax=Arthroderma gypseum (strain ATCC MYA-4604 / CBS 118893) TaxID=535722 RepID=E4UZ94_ARTGP|nr:integral membrane protein [Nannizzia gypsea CBS 118893]EFR03424.1 integral membrane protein [Nannizzia gypsea CBS 118893]